MPRSLEFGFEGRRFACSISKVDRRKLYGAVDIETIDVDGGECALASLARDGKTLIPFGGTAAGYVNPDGEWVFRKDLNPVDLDGEELEMVASSFDAPLELGETASIEEFLDHSVRLVYRLDAAESESTANGDMDAEFVRRIESGEIFRTGFSYRGGVSADPAFIMQGQDNAVWLLIAAVNQIDYVSLEQAAVCASTVELDDADDEEELDELSFDVL